MAWIHGCFIRARLSAAGAGYEHDGAGILDADLLAVHSCREAENGRIM